MELDDLEEGDLVAIRRYVDGGDDYEDYGATVTMIDVPTQSEVQAMYENDKLTEAEAREHPCAPDSRADDDLVLLQSGQQEFVAPVGAVAYIKKKADDRGVSMLEENLRIGSEVPEDILEDPED